MRQAILELDYPPLDQWPPGYVYCDTVEKIQQCFMIERKVYGLDVETTSLDPYDPDSVILSISLATAPGEGFGFYIGRKPTKAALVGIEMVKRLLARDDIMFVGHNVRFDIIFMMRKLEIPPHEMRAMYYDTQVANYFLNENDKFAPLERLAARYPDLEEYKRDIDRSKLEQYPKQDVVLYNIKDSDGPLRLRKDFNKELAVEGLMGIINVSSQLLPIIAKMQDRGICIDMEYAREMHRKLQAQMLDTRLTLKEKSGDIFNPNSNDDLLRILHKRLGYSTEKETATGKESTDFESLKRFRNEMIEEERDRDDIEFLDLILDYKKQFKLNHTYYNKIKEWLKADGKVHTNLHITGTETNRLSSSGPNMQNQRRGADFRGIFVPSDGHLYLDWDYAQLEMRIAAALAKEDRMIQMFTDGLDIHTAVLCDIFGYEYGDVQKILKTSSHKDYDKIKTQRVGIKGLNFGVLYGATAFRLMLELAKQGIVWTQEQCQELLDEWESKYSHIVRWRRIVEDFVIDNKVIPMPFGSLRRLPYACRETKEGRHELREAVNFVVQSTGAWLSYADMILVDSYFNEIPQIGGHILLQVHDSVLAEIYRLSGRRIQQVMDDIQEISTHGVKDYIKNVFKFELNVPLEIEIKALKRWE